MRNEWSNDNDKSKNSSNKKKARLVWKENKTSEETTQMTTSRKLYRGVPDRPIPLCDNPEDDEIEQCEIPISMRIPFLTTNRPFPGHPSSLVYPPRLALVGSVIDEVPILALQMNDNPEVDPVIAMKAKNDDPPLGLLTFRVIGNLPLVQLRLALE